MGAEASRAQGACCGGRPFGQGASPEEVEEGEFMEPHDVDKLLLENRAEVERALEQIGRRRTEVQESARRLEQQRAEATEVAKQLEAERQEIAGEWSRLEAGRGTLRSEREEVQRLQAELEAGQEALQVERQEVSRLRAEFQASQKNSWWFTCASTDGQKKCSDAKVLPHDATPTRPPAADGLHSEEFDPRRLSFETRLPAEMTRARGGG
uniref:Uncharacterized protein n=1 Tax=Alexandrium catenella TaxID=2925 RepID=A0A7S1MBV5_ALECA